MRNFSVLLVFLCFFQTVQAQYFGRNKVQYDAFDFRVAESPHFKLYHYFESDSMVNQLLSRSEKWYRMHADLLNDTIRFQNPLIVYANHADFQQTTAIGGSIGVGTGGVTEGLKNRVVMPVMESNTETDHVLGHELVHAFQYNLLRDNPDTTLSLQNIRNLPLWMVEGMAEYLSKGRVDAHTAMWMRDAYLNDDIPSLKDLSTNPKYFPYRYGQAFWAFVGGVWGDSLIQDMYIETARGGLDYALDTLLDINSKTLSNMWQNMLKTEYKKLGLEEMEGPVGTKLLSKENAGEMNISPALSPDGRYVAFLSEINLFSIDLFLADAQSGEVIRKLNSTVRSSHIDAFSYVESAGAWSPDSKKFAYVAFKKGRNVLIITDVISGKTLDEIAIPGLAAFSNPSWSPDGQSIVVTGLVEGKSDLYLYGLRNKQLVQLTNDPYSDLQPSWSADGSFIVFATDRLSISKGGYLGKYPTNIALYHVQEGRVEVLPFFYGANNLNPQVLPDNETIVFLTDRDGFRNAHSYNLKTDNLFRLTRLATGISGITAYSPALSVSRVSDEVVYSYFNQNKYSVYKAPMSAFLAELVQPFDVDLTPAMLPPFKPTGPQLIDKKLASLAPEGTLAPGQIEQHAYKPGFQLDYIGNTGIGISTSTFGTGLAGGVAASLSDMLSQHRLFGVLSVNGEIQDFGGQFGYINQKHRLNYGFSVSHIPFRTGRVQQVSDSVNVPLQKGDTTLAATNLQFDLIRLFEQKVSAFAYLPFSQTRRMEFGLSQAFYSYRIDRFNNYYFSFDGLPYRFQEREKLGDEFVPDGFNMQSAEIAYVGDNSYFGVASPLQGHRFRFSVEGFMGGMNYYGVLADYRRYFFVKPFTIAFRGFHYARYGSDAENGRLTPIFLGFPTLVHGYDDIDRSPARIGIEDEVMDFNNLLGSRIAVGNVEVRLPLTGPERLSTVKSRFLFTELNLFFDAGYAWDSGDLQFTSAEGATVNERRVEREPIFSTGISLRVNVFGQLIIEPYYAFPFQRNDIKGGTFGLNFSPGW